VPRIVRAGCHAQHLVELAYGHLASSLGNKVVVGTHRVGWPKITKAFFDMSNSCSVRLRQVRKARTSGSRATSSLPTSVTSYACCQRPSSLRLMPNCWAVACRLRLPQARRNASVLKVLSYLCRLFDAILLLFVLLTQEIYVLLLCASFRPPPL
jgi:hypothetical protein